MRRVECWACGEPIEAAGEEELRRSLAEHVEREHGAAPAGAEVARWIAAKGRGPDSGFETVLTIGRVLAGAAAVTFAFLAFQNPTDIGGTERTIQFLSFMGFAAVSAALLCGLTLLGRLLRRG